MILTPTQMFLQEHGFRAYTPDGNRIAIRSERKKRGSRSRLFQLCVPKTGEVIYERVVSNVTDRIKSFRYYENFELYKRYNMRSPIFCK